MRRHKTKVKGRQRGNNSKSSWYRRFKSTIGGFAVLIFITTFTLPVMAQEAEGAGEKLAEGVEEIATGWVEIPNEIAETSEEANLIEGVTVGTVKGAGEAVVKTATGAVKAATFYIPEEEEIEEEAGEEIEGEEAEDIEQ